jgi:alpha-ketoglutarate-dependent taurine dioxygenase
MAAILDAEPIAELIGARVRNGRQALLSGELAGDLRALLERRGVLVFPGIGFSDAELVAFTRTLGAYAPDHPDGRVTRISIDPAGGASARYTRASAFWHFDGYMNAVPILASVLAARVLPAEGGDTQFANTYAAYDALPEAERQAIADLRVIHALAGAQRAIDPEPSLAELKEWLRVPSATLPLVWTHKSGRKSLVLGNSAVGVVGMDPLASLELLVRLRDFATKDRFTYRHAWSAGDVVMWDNTGTLHRVHPYDPASGRLLVRTKLAGEEPIG